MTDRYNIHSQLEHLQSKYIGTGHADTSKWEWLVNQHRDSYCSYMGHFDLLNYFSVAENESKARVRFNLMEKMLQPCGPPADKPDDAWFRNKERIFFYIFLRMFFHDFFSPLCVFLYIQHYFVPKIFNDLSPWPSETSDHRIWTALHLCMKMKPGLISSYSLYLDFVCFSFQGNELWW